MDIQRFNARTNLLTQARLGLSHATSQELLLYLRLPRTEDGVDTWGIGVATQSESALGLGLGIGSRWRSILELLDR